MFNLDERYRGLPATREQVLALHISLNTPAVAIPGKQAGPAQAFVVGIRGGQGAAAVFVYLYLAEAADCAVYLSGRRNTTGDEYREDEGDALAFVESLGFMMDDANWRAAPPAQQDEWLKTLPVFFKEPKLVPAVVARAEEKKNVTTTLGRFLAAF
ncbi:social motility and stimulation tgl protein [Pyxidicoccus caerfyrddinensis]|uniref:social motility and stimulation tgl protein n=1 Tax=Pyxidicoccus caerfyrddinensis TaxID=2709663 RepID=UPI0013D94882|nr:social motility and stimulation tgl protein [Pyxidicoccus caerfyrddinensis]